MNRIRETLNVNKEMYKTTWMISLHLWWSFRVLKVECFSFGFIQIQNKHYLRQSSWNVCVLSWTDFCGLRRNLPPVRWLVPRISLGFYSAPPPKFWDVRGTEVSGRGWKVPVNNKKNIVSSIYIIFFNLFQNLINSNTKWPINWLHAWYSFNITLALYCIDKYSWL